MWGFEGCTGDWRNIQEQGQSWVKLRASLLSLSPSEVKFHLCILPTFSLCSYPTPIPSSVLRHISRELFQQLSPRLLLAWEGVFLCAPSPVWCRHGQVPRDPFSSPWSRAPSPGPDLARAILSQRGHWPHRLLHCPGCDAGHGRV